MNMGIIDWLADKVQTSTGEKERRELVQTVKELAVEFKEKVSEAVTRLNEKLSNFNQVLAKLNEFRSKSVKENIEQLNTFLSKYGRCKPYSAYIPESEKLPAEFPMRQMVQIEDYITEIDWSKDDVFRDTFWLSPLGMKFKTRNQNLSMHEHIGELKLQIEQTVREIDAQTFTAGLETEICNLYLSNVRMISEVITTKIIPEIELVDAFFQAEAIKDSVISESQSREIRFHYDICALIGTPYERHYQFIKNALMFYVISCKIYDTPVLTHLLSHTISIDDKQQIETEHKLLLQQARTVSNSMIVMRGEETN